MTERLTLSMKCLALRPRFYFDEEGKKLEARKYLVTEISGGTWPSHYPEIWHSRTNSNDTTANPEPTTLSKPFAKAPKARESDATTVVTQQQDAHANASTTNIRGSEWNWLGKKPTLHPLEKTHCKKYVGKPIPQQDDSTVVSAGARTYENDAASKAQPKNLVRVVDQRFEHLMNALEALRLDGSVDSFEPFPARRTAQQSDRSGYPCWKFIDEESIAYSRGPKYGWRVLRHGKGEHRSVSYRTALVVKVKAAAMTFHWIEIECKDNGGFRALLVSNLTSNVHRDLEAILELIVQSKGRHLDRFDDMTLSSDRIISCSYRHDYPEIRSGLSVDTVRNKIKELQQKQPG